MLCLLLCAAGAPGAAGASPGVLREPHAQSVVEEPPPPSAPQEKPPPADSDQSPDPAALRREIGRLLALLPESLRLPEPSPARDAVWAAWVEAAGTVVPFDDFAEGVELADELRVKLCRELKIDPDDDSGPDPLPLLQGLVAGGVHPYPSGRVAEILDAWIEANATAFAAIDAVIAGPSVRPSSAETPKGPTPPEDPGGPWKLGPSLSAFSSASELFALACARDLARNDLVAAAASWSRLARMAEEVSGLAPEGLLSGLMSQALLVWARSLAERIAEHPKVRAEDLETIQAFLSGATSTRAGSADFRAGSADFQAGLRRMLRGSVGCLAIAFLAEFGADLGPERFAEFVAKLQPQENRAAARAEVLSFIGGHPSLLLREETMRLLGERVEALLRDSPRPWHEVRPEAHSEDLRRELDPWPKELELLPGGLWLPGLPVPALLRSAPHSAEDRLRARQALSRVRNPLGKWLVLCELIALERGVSQAKALELERRLALVAVALARHERLKGNLPAVLPELAERGILREIPDDPYTGKPLLYSRERRLVWSVGTKGEAAAPEDLADRGGRERARQIPLSPGVGPAAQVGSPVLAEPDTAGPAVTPGVGPPITGSAGPAITSGAGPPIAAGEAPEPSVEGKAVEEFLSRVESPPPQHRCRIERHAASRKGHIISLRLSGADLKKEDFPLIGGLSRIATLDLSGTKVSDDDLPHLSKLDSLRDLDLWGTAVSGSALVHLAPLTRLEKLNLGDTKITNESLRHLKALVNLRSLGLASTEIGDAGLEHLMDLPRLETLRLTQTRITDAVLRRLRDLKSLRGLTLDETAVSEAGLASLAELPRFAWMSSPARTAAEVVRRLELGDHALVDAMVSVGLHFPDRGKFRLLKLDAIPPDDRDRERKLQRFHVELHWTNEEEKLDETFFADFDVERATVSVHQIGILPKPADRPSKPATPRS